jgi:hypothetical protein
MAAASIPPFAVIYDVHLTVFKEKLNSSEIALFHHRFHYFCAAKI